MSKAPCPRCRSKGGDRSGDNLTIYPDNAHCHACGFDLQGKDFKNYLEGNEVSVSEEPQWEKPDPQLELQLIQTYPFGAPHKPEISLEVCQEAGVRYSVGYDGLPDAVYYPYYTGGTIVDYKKRVLPKKFFNVTGDVRDAELFGGQKSPPPERRGLLIIVEGEDDKLAADTMFRLRGKNYTVRSLQNGANEEGTIDKSVRKQLEFITSFKKVALCLDMDDPGFATREALAELIAPRVEVRYMNLPRKDAYDMLKHSEVDEFMECLNNAEKFTPEGIIESSQITVEMLMEPSKPGYPYPYPKLEFMLHGDRDGEITLITAGTGVGKTTLVRELDYWSMKEHGLVCGQIYLEEQWKKTAQGLIAIDNNVPLPLLRVNPNIITREQWDTSHAKFFGRGKAHYFKHFGSVASETLMRKMYYMAYALGCQRITLDHITMVMSGQDSHDERKDIDILMTRLAEFVTETGVSVRAIVHLKRKGGDAASFNEGAEVSLTDLRGSSQLEALSFNVLAAERDQQSATTADIVTLRLLKNREWGFTGLADKLVYSHQTGRLLPIDTNL